MSLPSVPLSIETPTPARGSLARSMARALLGFTFITLTLMAGLMYFRARAVLQSEVVGQMQSLVKGQLGNSQNDFVIKQTRLERLVKRLDFRSATESLLHQSRTSPFFTISRNSLNDMFTEINREATSPIFNQYLILDDEGQVMVSSKLEWERSDLSGIPEFNSLREADGESIAVFDFSTFYPGQLVILTVSQYRTTDGIARATVIGVTEDESVAAILTSLTNLAPASRAYFVTTESLYIGVEAGTGELTPFQASTEQTNVLNEIFLSVEKNGAELIPVTAQFNNAAGEAALAQAVWAPELDTGVVLEVSSDAIFGNLDNLILFVAGVYIIALLLMAALISATTRRVVQPILALSSITNRFASGDWEERAVVNNADEVGQLATSINQMADQLSGLYTSLREQVQERTSQIRTAAEVAQGITTAFNLEQLLTNTTRLIVERFNFYHAGIFLLEPGGKQATLKAAHGPAADEMLRRGHHHVVGSASIVGWVSANLKPRVASDVKLDPIHSRNPLLPNTRAEAGIPIVLGEVILGVLDVQSTEPNTFDEEMVIVLQTLANQMAVAMQHASSTESPQSMTADVERLHRASNEIVKANSEQAIFAVASRALRESGHSFALIKIGESTSEIIDTNDARTARPSAQPSLLMTGSKEVTSRIANPMLINDLGASENIPAGLMELAINTGGKSAAFLPVHQAGRVQALLILGSQRSQPLTSTNVRPYTVFTESMGASIERVNAARDSAARIEELDALAKFNQNIFSGFEAATFYSALHTQAKRVIGDYSFVVALYEPRTNSISIPYAYEDGRTTSIEPFPLGEGLTSILIKTRRPLMLVEDTLRQAVALGAKIQGKPAKSWMGAPLLIGNEPIGAIIVQDQEQEHRFTERDLNFLVELSNQMAGVTYNLRMLERSRQSTVQLQAAAEIARDISGNLNLDELLQRAVNLIRDRFNFYHASIFLMDKQNENAVVREATGEPGAQLKRMGHKLTVGSKSIVGYVTGRGETLVVNDTTKDSTYFANPLLPDTRGEAAIPLKVGDRILGALDVQSIQPYAFNDENLRTLEILADQLAVAVVNTELFAETQEHLSQHRLLHHITMSAASGTTLEDALETAVKGLQVTLGGDRVAILLMDAERKQLELKASIGYSDEANNLHIPVGSGITGWVAIHRKPLRVDDVRNDPRYIQISSNTRSELALPLLYRNEVLGIINVESEQVAAYTDNDEEMLGTLAGSLAAIIANARLLDQIRRQSDRDRLLNEITSKIHRTTDMQVILATTASELTKAIGARRTQIKITQPQDTPNESDI